VVTILKNNFKIKSKKMIRKFFKWLFQSELRELNIQTKIVKENNLKFNSYEKTFKEVLSHIDVSVDVHDQKFDRYARSWAVVSLQGQKADYIKFIDLGNEDMRHIQLFLRQFERSNNIKIDARPDASKWLKLFH